MDTQVLSRLVNAGLDRVICGIESGAEHIRREVFRRRASNSHIFQSIAAMKAAGLKVTCNFILDNPFETDDDRRETFEMVSALSKTCLFNLFNLVFYPKTFVTNTAFARGLISSEEGHLQDETQPIQWLLNIDMFRFDRDPYYACLTVLSTIKFIPSRFIHRLSRGGSIRHNTAVMIWMIRILQRLHFVARGSMVVR